MVGAASTREQHFMFADNYLKIFAYYMREI